MNTPSLPLTPPDGWTLDNFPADLDLPKRTELIRGTLVHSPQTSWHRAVVDMLITRGRLGGVRGT